LWNSTALDIFIRFLTMAVYKRRPHKIANNRPPFSYPFGRTINFEKSEVFCIKKCGLQQLKKPLPPWVLSPLWTAP